MLAEAGQYPLRLTLITNLARVWNRFMEPWTTAAWPSKQAFTTTWVWRSRRRNTISYVLLAPQMGKLLTLEGAAPLDVDGITLMMNDYNNLCEVRGDLYRCPRAEMRANNRAAQLSCPRLMSQMQQGTSQPAGSPRTPPTVHEATMDGWMLQVWVRARSGVTYTDCSRFTKPRDSIAVDCFE